ncbi:MAG: DNA cytosine methyltransferase [Fervidicoccaceae archaeon]
MQRNREGFKVADLFCGGGGFARGFKEKGFSILFGIDNLKSAAKTYKANFPKAVVLAEDIKEITGETIKSLVGDVDVLIGSPPCEPFTAANKQRKRDPLDRLYSDPQGILTLNFFRILSEVKPKVWVMENVPAIMENGLKDSLAREARRAGYSRIYFNVLRAEDYCTPSRRTRLFLSNIPISPERCNKRVTVWEAIGDLPPPNPSFPPNHEPPSISPRKQKKIGRLQRGKAMIYYEGFGGKPLPNLIRLDPDDIAPTVLGSSRFIHPYEDRFLTVREQARLMGYPDNHVFIGGRDEQYNMVGESVPVTLSSAIANEVLNYLRKEDGL